MQNRNEASAQRVERELALLHEIQRIIARPLSEEQVGVLKKLCEALEKKMLEPQYVKNHSLAEGDRLQAQASKGKVSEGNENQDSQKPKLK